jgi:acetyl-CoA acetyltransferase
LLFAVNMAGRDVFIVGCVRTPIGRGLCFYRTGTGIGDAYVRAGKEDGMLYGIHPVELLAMTLDELMRRTGAPKAAVEDVICGVVTPCQEQVLFLFS